MPGLSPDVDPLSTSATLAPVPGAHASTTPPSNGSLAQNPVTTALTSSSIPTTTALPDPAYAGDFTVQEMADFDFGPLEPVFDWQHVNLFENNGQPFDFAGGAL